MPDSPTPPIEPTIDMPPSVPPGMRLELNRARLLPGASEETGRWMQMLHDRYEECLDTLSAERMAFEATFRHTDTDGTEWIYHVSLYGEGNRAWTPPTRSTGSTRITPCAARSAAGRNCARC